MTEPQLFTDSEAPKVPGALEYTLRREVPQGLIEFEYAPVGWTTKSGTPRKVPHRRYYWTPAGESGIDGAAREQLVSTTTLLDVVCPKPGLAPWAEARGIEGALQAVEQGLIEPDSVWAQPEHAVSIVRDNELGADAAKKRAAERGVNVHDLLRAYMETGEPPRLTDHPAEHHGYISALASWIMQRNPEPEAVEQLVADPAAGYAGRLDLRARMRPSFEFGKVLTTVDVKTQERAGIYRGAHLQVSMYEWAARVCGDLAADALMVVVFAKDGQWREMEVESKTHDAVNAALDYYRLVKPIDSACESENRREREARA